MGSGFRLCSKATGQDTEESRMIGIYERVSSDTQSTESQHHDLERWAADREVRWFTDSYTGKTMERPGWSRLWRQCCQGKLDTIVVWRLDRLGRTARGLLNLRDELVERKLNLISLRDAIDLSTASGRLMFGVIASVAEYEIEIRRERQLAGIIVAKQKGTYRGRVKGQRNRRTREMQDTVITMHKAGVSVRGIAKATQLWRGSVIRIIHEWAEARKERVR
jgi:DNA invertase Pin-like site-specific DNA recombinase